MKPQTSLPNLIPILIIVLGVMALAIAIPNTLLNLGDNFLSLFSVTQVFWMGVLWVMVGTLLLVWRQSAAHLRRMVAILIIALGMVGVLFAAVGGFFNGTDMLGTFRLPDIFWMSMLYAAVGFLLLVIFRSNSEAETPTASQAAQDGEKLSLGIGRAATPVNQPIKLDDLTILEGIGPKVQEALYKAGITTFAQLAQMTPQEIEQVVKVEGQVRMVGDALTWPRQAQYLVDGDAVGFEAYIKKLVAGRDPDQK